MTRRAALPAVVHSGIEWPPACGERERWGYTVREAPMGRFAAILLAVTGTVALQVLAQAVLLASVRFIGRRTRGATERCLLTSRSSPSPRWVMAISCWHRTTVSLARSGPLAVR